MHYARFPCDTSVRTVIHENLLVSICKFIESIPGDNMAT